MAPPAIDDTELGHVRDGYPALAAWMERDPDGETLVFRKFGRLSSRNLLRLQCNLIELEADIHKLDEEARSKFATDMAAGEASRRWETFMELAADAKSLERRRLAKLEDLEIKMKEYRKSFSVCKLVSHSDAE
jgi:hypothetical protein